MLVVNIFADQCEGDQAVIQPSANQRKFSDKCLSPIAHELRTCMKLLKCDETQQIAKQTHESPLIACSANQSQLTISPIPKVVNNMPSFTRRLDSAQLRQFECPLCLHGYRSQTLLNDHMRKEHSVLI